jgi:hypothetical protein
MNIHPARASDARGEAAEQMLSIREGATVPRAVERYEAYGRPSSFIG